MSYGRPPSKSPYGDTDFSDDSLPQQGTSSLSQPPLQSQNYAPQPGYQPPMSQYPTNASRVGNSNDNLAELPNNISGLAKSITQEDILFMRSWQQDSFFKRVLPLTAVSSGILFFYNKQRNVPNKVSHFLAVALVSFAVGKWSYRGEFKRRIMETKLNTPYLQALRRAIGLPPIVDDSGFDNTTGFASSNYNLEDPSKSFSGFGSQQYPSGNLQANQPSNMDNHGLDTGKPATSYEELRAKNRGYTR